MWRQLQIIIQLLWERIILTFPGLSGQDLESQQQRCLTLLFSVPTAGPITVDRGFAEFQVILPQADEEDTIFVPILGMTKLRPTGYESCPTLHS